MTKKTAKPKAFKPRIEYAVEVSYDARFYFDIPIEDTDHPDKVISKYLKKRRGGSGCGFGCRDLSFYYRSKKDAEKVKGLIAKAPFKKKWKVVVGEVYISGG
jgi:hypothetical protein